MKRAQQNHMNLTKLAGSHLFLKAARSRRYLLSDAKATSSGASGSNNPCWTGGLLVRSLPTSVSCSPVHHEDVNIRCVSDSDCRRPRCRSWFIRIVNAIMSGIAIMKKVQHIHVVLKCVIQREPGKKYIGIGTAMEMRAMAEIVNGNPRLWGHLWRY